MCERKLITLALLFLINPLVADLYGQIPTRYSIVIDEILADPAPTIGLPNAEFIELRNVSDSSINLKQWRISDGTSTATINIDYFLQPDSCVVICSTPAVILFSSFGPSIGVSNFPSLNNEMDVISLYSPERRCIHVVAYHMNWFNNAIKSEGGWTLEMVDTKNPCSAEENWRASIDARGGTPGTKNSVDGHNPDVQPPAFIRAYAIDSITVAAVFNEPLDSNEAMIPHRYILDDPSVMTLTSALKGPLFNEVELKFSRPLQFGKTYQLSITGIKDCSSNSIGLFNKRPIGRPVMPDSLSLAINEILFNPVSDGTDYVELFNKSDRIFDLSRLYISNRASSGTINPPKRISEVPLLFFPGDYIAVSESGKNVQQHFFTSKGDCLLDISSLPSFPDDRGAVVILNEQGRIIDELNYDQSWQFPLLPVREGVSLERVDPNGKTQLKDNWSSAASTVGYGTPGLQNSQFRSVGLQAVLISVDPPVFSPDNDGVDDNCFIGYELAEPNYIASIWVFDAHGREVRKLYNNITLQQKGILRWDGFSENSKPLPGGIYIIYTEIFNLRGSRKKFKNPVTLARKF
jgi:hypothetical protein